MTDTTIIISPAPKGGSALQIYTRGDTLEEAKAAAVHAFEEALGDRKAIVRVNPCAEEFHDFASGRTEYRGRARAWFYDEPGPRTMVSDLPGYGGFVKFVPFGTLNAPAS